MNPFSPFRSGLLLGILLTARLPMAGAADPGAGRLRVERWSPAGEPGGFDESAMQTIARQMGPGHFFVRDITLSANSPDGATQRFLAVFSSVEAVRSHRPVKRVLYRESGPAEAKTIESIDDELGRLIPLSDSDLTLSRKMPDVLAAVLFDGSDRWCTAGNNRDIGWSDDERARLTPDRQDEWRELWREPKILRDKTGALSWQGRYWRRDGGLEEVRVTLTQAEPTRVRLERAELRPPGYFGAGAESPPLEEWYVAKDSGWKAPQRYKLMLMLAALGNVPKQFELGTALLQETDEGAKEEGLKWLEAAAAQGHRDAADLLEQSRDQLVRADRDRDKVRLSRCCPVPGR